MECLRRLDCSLYACIFFFHLSRLACVSETCCMIQLPFPRGIELLIEDPSLSSVLQEGIKEKLASFIYKPHLYC